MPWRMVLGWEARFSAYGGLLIKGLKEWNIVGEHTACLSHIACYLLASSGNPILSIYPRRCHLPSVTHQFLTLHHLCFLCETSPHLIVSARQRPLRLTDGPPFSLTVNSSLDSASSQPLECHAHNVAQAQTSYRICYIVTVWIRNSELICATQSQTNCTPPWCALKRTRVLLRSTAQYLPLTSSGRFSIPSAPSASAILRATCMLHTVWHQSTPFKSRGSHHSQSLRG